MNKNGGIFGLILLILLILFIVAVAISIAATINSLEDNTDDLSFFCEKHGYKNYTISLLEKFECYNIHNGYINKVKVSQINGEFYIENE